MAIPVTLIFVLPLVLAAVIATLTIYVSLLQYLCALYWFIPDLVRPSWSSVRLVDFLFANVLMLVLTLYIFRLSIIYERYVCALLVGTAPTWDATIGYIIAGQAGAHALKALTGDYREEYWKNKDNPVQQRQLKVRYHFEFFCEILNMIGIVFKNAMVWPLQIIGLYRHSNQHLDDSE
ncbi:MAG: hypothetical protein ACRBCJ_11140 [Hyphomicrobiaceae bacterium]